jgi:hypothetical protein
MPRVIAGNAFSTRVTYRRIRRGFVLRTATLACWPAETQRRAGSLGFPGSIDAERD